jgi:hypothetical protein
MPGRTENQMIVWLLAFPPQNMAVEKLTGAGFEFFNF